MRTLLLVILSALCLSAPLAAAEPDYRGPLYDRPIWKDAGQSVELHVYEVPNFSMTVDLWGDRLFDWMAEQNLLSASK